MMQRPLDVSLSEAIITKIPLIIVEGIDDRQIYTNICKHFSIDVKIMRVAEFENFAAGCKNVIKCINELQTNFTKNPNSLRYVLGIIDKDSRPYKDATEFVLLNNLQGLFVLKHYSIETYFATKNNIKALICKATNAISSDITQEIIDFVEANINEKLEILYYLAVDTLKEHLLGNETYKAFKSYEQDATSAVVNTPLEAFSKKLSTIRGDLDLFANQYSLSSTDIKNVVKGKWFLCYFVNRIVTQIDELYKIEKEANEAYKRSMACKAQIYSFEPIFKSKLIGDHEQKTKMAYDYILDCFDEHELQDILDKLRSLT